MNLKKLQSKINLINLQKRKEVHKKLQNIPEELFFNLETCIWKMLEINYGSIVFFNFLFTIFKVKYLKFYLYIYEPYSYNYLCLRKIFTLQLFGQLK